MSDMVEEKLEKPNIKGDRVNIILLLFLYFLQGGTAALRMTLPIILQNRNVSYADQAELSITGYPYCLKLLWSPIIDCTYSKRFGRRKTWLVPMQYLMGIVLLCVWMYSDDWLGSEDGTQKPRIRVLAVIFFLCTLFVAIQDVALDGWALTMLQRRNIGYSGICQNIGSLMGFLSTFPLLILLDSKDFCNKFRAVPQDRGFVSFADFSLYWSILLVLSTTVLFIFKKDNSLEVIGDQNCESKLGLKDSYKQLWRIIRLPSVVTLLLILFTYRMGFGPLDGVAPLKLIDAGITQDNFVFLNVSSFPLQMVLSVTVLRRWVTGPRSMHCFITTYTLKLIASVLVATAIFFSAYSKYEDGVLPTWFFWILLFVVSLKNIIDYLTIVSVLTFFCRVSDARYGGMYMALWGSMASIGYNWPLTLSLACVDLLTIKRCVRNEEQNVEICETTLDGFYVEMVLFTILGAVWLCWSKKEIFRLEKLPASAWTVEQEKTSLEESEELQKIDIDRQ